VFCESASYRPPVGHSGPIREKTNVRHSRVPENKKI
jgi:hypothetical protein